MKLAGWLCVIVASVGVASYFAFQRERADTPWVWIIMAVPTLAFAAVGVWRLRRDGELDRVKPKWGDFTRGFLGAIVLFAATLAMTKLFMRPGGASPRSMWIPTLYTQVGAQSMQAHAAAVALAIVVMAVGEELLWRGLVTRLLEEHFGSRWAWVYAAGLYSLAHVPSMWALRSPLGTLNPILPIAALGAGLVWGAMARSFGRLTPGILAHALFVWCVLMMFPLATLRQG